MAVNYLVLLVLVLLLALFVWLAVRSWRSRRGAVRWIGGILTSLLALVFLAAVGVFALGLFRLEVAPHSYAKPDAAAFNVPPERVKWAEQKVVACAGCHSSTGGLPLDGSKDNFLGGPMGVLYAPNLTPAGPLKDMSDGEIMRAIREGVRKDGKPLLVMPSQTFHNLSDEDARALVAALRAMPAVERSLPERAPGPMAVFIIGSGMFPTSAQTPITQPIATPPTGTPEYGKYMANSMGCIDCHGTDLRGLNTGFATGPDLTARVPTWELADFMMVFNEGKDPTSGRPLSPDMPYKDYRLAFTDDELKDIFTYIQTLKRAEGQ